MRVLWGGDVLRSRKRVEEGKYDKVRIHIATTAFIVIC